MNPSASAPIPHPRSSLEEDDDGLDEWIAENEEVLENDFTFRAVSVGLLVGVLLCMTNTYFGLQTGWVSMMSLQSALVGFGLLKTLPAAIPKLLPMKKPFTPQENVILQTVAVATGTMPLAAGLVGIIPALEMMTLELDGREGITLGYWGLDSTELCWSWDPAIIVGLCFIVCIR